MQSRFLVQVMGVLIAMFLLSSQSFAQTEDHPIEVGVVVTTIDLRDSVAEKPLGIGVRFAYNFTRNLAIDGEIVHFPENPSNNFGQTIVLAGLKAGLRTEKFGAFAKARPGVAHFGGEAFRARNNTQSRIAFDVGGVLEFYPSSRVIIRVDVGDTIIPFGDDVINRPVPPFVFRPGTTHNFQTSFGIGYRF
jgi:hypothetical protein